MSVQETYLKAIADAIRAKTGETGTIQASQFATKIAGISTGVAKPGWISRSVSSNKNWNSICYGNGKFVAVSYGGNGVVYSATGNGAWTAATLPSIGPWTSVCYGNGKFVAVCDNSASAAYSTDGINWTQISMPATRNWSEVCYGNGKFVAASGGPSRYFAYINDSFDSWA